MSGPWRCLTDFRIMSNLSGNAACRDLTSVASPPLPSSGILPCMGGLAIPEEKRSHLDSQRGWQARLSASFACASLVCSLSFWLVFTLYYLQASLRLNLPGWRWINSFTSPQWVLFEAFALGLAIVATVLGLFWGAKLWRIALPVALLMFLFMYYVMVS